MTASPDSAEPSPNGRGRAWLLALGLLLLGAMVARAYSSLINRQYSLKLSESYRVDINSAAVPDLELLPGIDVGLARAIVAERRANGPFLGGADLQKRVHGMGPKTVEGLFEFAVFSR